MTRDVEVASREMRIATGETMNLLASGRWRERGDPEVLDEGLAFS